MAKRCPLCDNSWDDSYEICPMDGGALASNRKILPNFSPQPVQVDSGENQDANVNSQNTTASASVQANQSNYNAQKNINPSYVEGIVRNFNEDFIKTNIVKQWFLSLRKGCSFVTDGNIYSFDVMENNGDIHSVVLYGKVIRGRFQDHSRVRVYGKHDRSGTIIANQIENLGSNSAVQMNKALSNISVKILTGLMLFIIGYLVFFVDYMHLFDVVLSSIFSLISAIVSFIFSTLYALIPLIIILLVLWFMIRKIFK